MNDKNAFLIEDIDICHIFIPLISQIFIILYLYTFSYHFYTNVRINFFEFELQYALNKYV